MLGWAFAFFMLTLIFGVLGYGGIANSSLTMARLPFFLFLGLFISCFISALIGVRKSPKQQATKREVRKG